MRTWIERRTRADPGRVLALAARVEDWPGLLPHYRSVTVLAVMSSGDRIVDMRARRDVFADRLAIPLHWIARQRVLEDRVEFVHVGGVTRGMEVAWTWHPIADGRAAIRIEHSFSPRWPVPDQVVHAIVGDVFVNSVAYRTLRTLCGHAERRTVHHLTGHGTMPN